ncbi:S8 family serine peptidase [Solwaraspora sp. WMMB335]|uniref:S8 family serine peptidase n=1 Tax=Solwaraspora sp. WMMB335 TaxID=3404118 RepID=UPI003B94370A
MTAAAAFGAVLLVGLLTTPIAAQPARSAPVPARSVPAVGVGVNVGVGTATLAAARAECAPPATTPYPQRPWPQTRLAPERAWTFSRGDGIVVAVLDTGVSGTAPALAGRVLRGRDVLTGGPADTDCSGHGTFVAGLVAAAGMPGTGFSGIAPGARILPIRVADQFESIHPDRLAEGIEAAVQGGASIIVVVPTAPFGSPALTSAVEYAERSDRLVVATAVDQFAGDGTPAQPAVLPTVLSVAAIDSDGAGTATAVGADGTDPAVPDLAAPGTDLISVAPTGRGNVTASAEALATGFVAGVAALVRGYLPGATPAQVRARLTGTADPAPPSARRSLGAGVVDPMAAVSAVDPPPVPVPGDELAGPPPPQLGPSVRPYDPRSTRAAAAWLGGVAVGSAVGAMAVAAIVAARRRQRVQRPAATSSAASGGAG